ncbi:hypothetical protein TUM3794_28360 [Shewanella colwelliana]|uniref:Orphan protein n=1 Tax=Shewanella colwelliana TaxID=23 RepID=A0ABQ4P6R1_SHECO|nr:hypothetical protein [Shewanella colwelliana]GIU43219.1 hypothetical protein TUM3794_28360 [Shewanella colwelliana]
MTGLSDNKKLVLLCRIEPGCLGPDGIDHIANFCRFANGALKHVDAEFIKWRPLPRYDKSLDEIEYSIAGKGLTRPQAAQYLAVFDKSLEEFEEHFHDTLTELIDIYLAKK